MELIHHSIGRVAGFVRIEPGQRLFSLYNGAEVPLTRENLRALICEMTDALRELVAVYDTLEKK